MANVYLSPSDLFVLSSFEAYYAVAGEKALELLSPRLRIVAEYQIQKREMSRLCRELEEAGV